MGRTGIGRILIGVFIFVIVGYIAYRMFNKKEEPSQFRNVIVNLNHKLRESRARVSQLEERVIGYEKKSQESIKKTERILAFQNAVLKKIKLAHRNTIDSLFFVFYPDSNRRDIVATHVQAELCDSIRA